VSRDHYASNHDAGDRHALGSAGGDFDAHWVSDEPYDAEADLQALDRQDLDASTGALIWRRFRRNKLAVISGLYLLAIYLALPFVGFFAPYHPQERNTDAIYAPPQDIDFFVNGHFAVTYPMVSEINMETFQPEFTQDMDDPRPLRWLTRCGRPWTFLGLAETDFRLICPPEGAQFYLLGADRLGRDMHSRILHGAQLSLTVGLIAA
jgi:peptide/nickel transport system permease protein